MTPLSRLRRTLLSLFMALTLAFQPFVQPAPQAQLNMNSSSRDTMRFGLPSSFNQLGSGGNQATINAGISVGAGGNFLGCSGVGMFDYIRAQFNMSNMIDFLKMAMMTYLAKVILAFAFSFPGVAEVFNTLQSIANMKFSMFQQSCNMSDIRKEAYDMFLKRCSEGSTDASKIVECEQKWKSGSSLFGDSTFKDLTKFICQSENVNLTGRGTICPGGGACAPMLMMPQIRINLGGKALNCGSSKNYGQTPAPMSVERGYNYNLQGVGNLYARVKDAYNKGEAGTTPAQRQMALSNAIDKCQQGACGGASGSTNSLASAGNKGMIFDPSKPLIVSRFAGVESDDNANTIQNMKRRFDCPEPNKIPSFYLMNEYLTQLSQLSGNNDFTPLQPESIDLSTAGASSDSGVSGQDPGQFAKNSDIAIKCSIKRNNVMDPTLHVRALDGQNGSQTRADGAMKADFADLAQLSWKSQCRQYADEIKKAAVVVANSKATNQSDALPQTANNKAGEATDNIDSAKQGEAMRAGGESLENDCKEFDETLNEVRKRTIEKNAALSAPDEDE